MNIPGTIARAAKGAAEVARIGARKALDALIPVDPSIAAIEAMSLEGYKELAFEPERFANGDGVLSFFPYCEPRIKDGLVELKMRRNMRIARLVGAAIYEELVAEASDISLFGRGSSPLLIPIPMARKDLRARGWNQCELMLAEVRRRDRGGIFEIDPRALAKTRQTGDQVGKSRRDRIDSLRGSFAATDEARARGRDAIIFDDILTTGATLSEARRALVAAGARSVLLSSVARAGGR